MSDQGGGGEKSKTTRKKKPRETSTLDSVKECHEKLAGAREKADKSEQRWETAKNNRVTYLCDMSLQDARNNYKSVANVTSKLLHFLVERMMKCEFIETQALKECDKTFVSTAVRTFIDSPVRINIVQPSAPFSAQSTIVTIVIAGTARKNNNTYVPPRAVFRLLYEPSISASYNNFEHVRVPYAVAAQLFPDSARYVMVDEYHVPPREGIPLTAKDETMIVRAFKPAPSTSRLYMQVCPAIPNGKAPELSEIPLGPPFTSLDAFFEFACECLPNAQELRELYEGLEEYDRQHLFKSFTDTLLNRLLKILSSIHHGVQEDAVESFQCRYISPEFLQGVWPNATSFSDAIAIAADHFQGKRRKLPVLRKSAKSLSLAHFRPRDDSSSSSSSSDEEDNEQ